MISVVSVKMAKPKNHQDQNNLQENFETVAKS